MEYHWYTNKMTQDVVNGCQEINDIILIVKNNGGQVYFPEYNFNGIGDFLPGQGYLLKVTDSYQYFSPLLKYLNFLRSFQKRINDNHQWELIGLVILSNFLTFFISYI